MKRICAWCSQELDQVERRDNESLTHGLCASCRKLYFPEAKNVRPVENSDGGRDFGSRQRE